MKILVSILALMLLPSWTSAQTLPVLFYTDIESGPASGGEGGKDGAFVCVYGENFGATRGNSSIQIGGVEVSAYKLWTDPGQPYRPGNYAKACGQISNWTRAGAVDVAVVTADGNSNRLPFKIANGKVYFVAADGNDLGGEGSSENPWETIKHCKQQMQPGDICYVKDLKVGTHENYGAALWLDSSGTADSPKAIVGYPGSHVVIGDPTGKFLSRALSNFKPGGNAGYWTLAGLTFNGPIVGVQLYATRGIRFVDDDVTCNGPHCYGPAGGLIVGGPGVPTSNITVLGSRFHDIGCHEHPDYNFSDHPCVWVPTAASTISTSGKEWNVTIPVGSFGAGDVIEANGQLRRVLTCDAGCRSGKLDAPFTPDLPEGTKWQWRFAAPPKLFHSVYFGNTSSVEFGWNEIDGRYGQACRGLLFHSTAAADEFDLHIHDNDIHDTVCDCITLSTVDPSHGPVEVYNNTLHHCGVGSSTISQSSFAGVYVANAGDGLPNPTRHGSVQVFNNTIFDAGSGGAPGNNTACFALQASASPKHGTAGLNVTNNVCVQRGVNGESYVSLIGKDFATKKPAASFVTGSHNDCNGLSTGCPKEFTQSIYAAPNFLRPDHSDFHLSDKSSIGKSGVSAGAPKTDQDGRVRPPKPTVGAYEWVQPTK
jgi:hypothetical protein